MKKAQCGSCIYYLAQGQVCRRYPPTAMVLQQPKESRIELLPGNPPQMPGAVIGTEFPHIGADGWCGEFAPVAEYIMSEEKG